MAKVTVWHKLSIEHRGRKISGSYAYLRDERLVQVRTPKGAKSKELGVSEVADSIAKLLLAELAAEGNV